ncbi:putative 2OG-Fe(II) oxygenase [Methylorubrum aminovorans]
MPQSQPDTQVIALFPTPIMVAKGILTPDEIEATKVYIYSSARQQNGRSSNLLHTDILYGALPPCFDLINTRVMPMMEQFASLLLGEQLQWHINGMWGNLGRPGASQPPHNHSNSMISGIIYLTTEDQSGTTRFHKPQTDLHFSLSHNNISAQPNVFNASTWFLGSVDPGDAVLFPSFLTHHVPEVIGKERITVAFNAIPEKIDCSGYVIRFDRGAS